MKKLHLTFGILFIIIFCLTGAYLRVNRPGLYNGSDVIRMMYRANHIYIILAALVNLGLGLYMTKITETESRLSRGLEILGSILILVAPVLLCVVFFIEPAKGDLYYRPYTFYGIVTIFAGGVAHFLVALLEQIFTKLKRK